MSTSTTDMAKKVLTLIKLQIPGGQANPAPPVGPALGQHGVNIMEFCKAFNAQTAHENGRIIPVEITVFEDRSFTFITKTPPAAVLIKEALRHREGLRRAEPRQGRPAHARRRCAQIAETKMPDLNARDVEQAMKVIAGTARSMGVEVDTDEQPRQALPRRARDAIDREQAYTPLEAVRLLKGIAGREVRRDRRGALPPRPERPPRRRSSSAARSCSRTAPARTSRVAVFAEGEKAREAEEAGADVVGSADLATQDRGRLRRLRRRDRDARTRWASSASSAASSARAG